MCEICAKRIGAVVFEIAAPENGEVVSGRKKLKTFAKDVGTKKNRKQLAEGKKISKRKTGGTRSNSRKSRSKKNVAPKRHFMYGAFTSSSLEIFDKESVLETIMSSTQKLQCHSPVLLWMKAV